MIQFILNDQNIATDAPVGTTLLDFVRENQHLKGTKCGCREGDCGACSVLIGELSSEKMAYQNVTSCLTPIGNIQGKHVVTVEGINVSERQNLSKNAVYTEGSSQTSNFKVQSLKSDNQSLTPVQKAMSDEGATQCGFCTVGFVMSLTGFCLSEKNAQNEDVIAAIDGNICRCTGYKSIERAALKIAHLKDKNSGHPTDFCIENDIVPPYFSDINERLKKLSAFSRQPSATAKIVGGGTDLYVQKHDEMTHADIDFLFNDALLRGVKKIGNRCEIGAAATVSDLKNSDFLNLAFKNLQKHLKLVSSTPIRNIATLAGNFVNASPIGDMTVFFLALNSVLVLKNKEGNRREIALKDFYKGYKTLDKTADEIVEIFHFDLPKTGNAFFNFEKVCKRTHLDIASVNSAILLTVNDLELIETVHLAFGGVAPTPFFATKTAAFLIGKPINEATVIAANAILQTEIAPISDVRGSEKYKRLLAKQLLLAHFEVLSNN
jgi:xanthine dehydrogenase small subunit